MSAVAFVSCRCGCGKPATILDDRRRTRSGFIRGHHPEFHTNRVRGTCTVEDCGRPHLARGFCKLHYSRWRKTGTYELRDATPILERFWRLVDRRAEDECWPWRGAVSGKYGRFALGGRNEGNVQAHRFSYALLVGPISEGHELDHECENKLCVNPRHLWPVTAREHARRTAERRRGQTPKSLSKPRRERG